MPDRCNSSQEKSTSAPPKNAHAASFEVPETLLGERHENDVDGIVVSLTQLARSIGFSESEADELTQLYETKLEDMTK